MESTRPASRASAIRVVLADDHPLVREALARRLDEEWDMRVVARCTRVDDVVSTVRACGPDILVLNVGMAGAALSAVLRNLKRELASPRTIVLCATTEEESVGDAMRLGVAGVLLEDVAPQLIVRCVRRVHGGETWLDQARLGKAVRSRRQRRWVDTTMSKALTPRELDVVRLVAEGLRNRDIADRLSVTEGTVKIHLHNIYEKVGLEGRLALASWARETGVV